MDRVVMIVDWENVRNMIKFVFDSENINYSDAVKKINFSYHKHIHNLCLSFIDNEGRFVEEGEKLIRLLIYTAWDLDPLAKRILKEMASRGEKEKKYVDSIFKKLKKTEDIMKVLRVERYVTLRTGVVGIKKFRLGSIEYGVPVQKKVDMLMGIDMFTYAYSDRVDGIILFLNDQDVIPAIKAVKRKGIRITLATFSEAIYDYKLVSVPLMQHCDEIRLIKLKELKEGKGDLEIYEVKR